MGDMRGCVYLIDSQFNAINNVSAVHVIFTWTARLLTLRIITYRNKLDNCSDCVVKLKASSPVTT